MAEGEAPCEARPDDWDEELYQRALPDFQYAWVQFKTSGGGLRDFVKVVLDQVGPGVQPYLRHFVLREADKDGIPQTPQAKSQEQRQEVDDDLGDLLDEGGSPPTARGPEAPYGEWFEGVEPARYTRVLPAFQQIYRAFNAAGKDAKAFVAFVTQRFGPEIRPYLKQFVLREPNKEGPPHGRPAEPATTPVGGPGAPPSPPPAPQLGVWGLQAKEHWRKYRPSLYQELVKAGTLEHVLAQAEERTKEAIADLVEQGTPFHQAWELLRHEWLFPEEEPGASERLYQEGPEGSVNHPL